jgi:hypothetical protein
MEAVMSIRQCIGACVFLLMMSAPVLAQAPAGSFEQLIADGAIKPRQTVYVTDVWGHRVKGRLFELRPGRVVLMRGSQTIEMNEAEVSRIQRHDSVQGGLWLGFAAGLAAGLVAPHFFCNLPDPECAAPVFAAVGLPSIAGGAIAGALIDGAIKKTVFQSGGRLDMVRIQVSPMLNSRRTGALATIGF